ncbi:Major facilitator superfamily domain general substrate transporter [Penicillium verhagenii]|uniref:Major facilitator superfamily domain general substrate transporter n=1 Tax=Penicillium verhagenii TaxID=1562060 RepID=UPI00254530A2|nr:Major facilitator superfamily domain general substrate transporter [Penicillium verhagenii]KAJ5917149.1 Major facilitator superfamily domain general substrate transporter [Penicillium verhagenii]
MATEEKTAQVSAIQKDSPGASVLEDSDQESQQKQGYETGTFEIKEGHEFYRPIDSYEGIHRWDPEFEWTEEEERKVVRKIDARVLTFACVTFFALQLDRGNIGQALASTFLKDLKMTSNDYNLGQTIFLVCFLLAEMPSQLISKRLGPDRWIPTQMILWSIVAACQAFLKGRSSFLATRALLGLLEGGFIPDTVLFLSFFYKSKELPKRLACFWISDTLTGIVGAFLAFGFLHIKNSDGEGAWRYLFAFEGLITGVVGIIAVFWMPASPVQTRGGLRGKDGWFTEHEEKIIVNRVIRDDPSKGSMHNRQAVTPKLLWQSLQDYHMWPIYLLGLIWLIPSTPATNYLTLQLKEVGFGTFETNLLSIPSAVVAIITVITITLIAERTNQRLLCGAVVELWNLILLITLEVLPAKALPWPRFAILTLLVGTPSVHPVIVALTSRNAGSISAIAGANVYRTDDAPYYKHGNKVLIALAVVSLVMFIGAKFYYDWCNRQNATKWNALTSEQREEYLRANPTTTNKRIDFRFSQ